MQFRPVDTLAGGTIPVDVRVDVCDRIYRYAYCCDTKQYDALPGLFAEDGVFDERCLGFPLVKGQEELRRVFSVPSGKYVYFVHFISNVMLHGYDGESVRAISYLRGEGLLATGARPIILGYYDDVFVRRDGDWLIGSRCLVPFAAPSGFSVTK
ncbi:MULTISPECIES: nuclear transport factor 2 family protein [unclassified Sphingobium]|uniref:nuclear transport factor 2 family protein n=1 Tax=unclassified Sphingobium TaxID=2611147 RepID=UPI0035A71C5E